MGALNRFLRRKDRLLPSKASCSLGPDRGCFLDSSCCVRSWVEDEIRRVKYFALVIMEEVVLVVAVWDALECEEIVKENKDRERDRRPREDEVEEPASTEPEIELGVEG